ncbi:caspase-3-like [Acanthaster planci]|uniref:Caspase-8 n=1 Tax=Acanthaster planci TaxID=133434 RepID=A0A8B7YFD5_ACAPL|nr:caspase-3-like [Acanthaster planci]XP_022090366.1 caspase-3-like [Acanthaster planci]
MEKHHKEALRKNRVALVQDMNLTYVFDALVERNIFEPADYEDFKEEGKTSRKINQVFLNALERRGPRAFDAFVDSLREHKQGILADILDPASAPKYPAQIKSRPGRVVDNPTDSLTGPQGDSKFEPMDTQPAKSVITSPTDDQPKVIWPGNSPALVTGMEMPASPIPPANQDASDIDNVYQMKSKPRGIAIIINNKHFRTMNTRKGTDIDGKNLNYVFEKLGFTTLVKNDQTGEQMQQIFRDTASHNHSTFDCFILAILTHGVEGAIYGTDERIVKIEHITSYFEGGRCPTLAGKPKLFFLQACRGERFDSGHEATDSKAVAPSDADATQDSIAPLSDEELAQRMLQRELEDDTDASNAIRSKLPSQSDMLLAYATVPGFVSWRNSERGSWFVQAMSEVFMEHAPKEDLLSMMTIVNNKVALAFESSSGRNKQIPAPVTMLRKKLYFNPGH